MNLEALEKMSFVQKLEDRPKTKVALEEMINSGLVQGDYDSLVILVKDEETSSRIINLVAEYLEHKEAKDNSLAKQKAQEINSIFDNLL